jgi:hypothetical protein
MALDRIHRQAVTDKLLNLLRELMSEPALREFNLVGGTALSLLLGHRRSIDIDLFSNVSFNAERLADWLVESYEIGKFSVEQNSVSGIIRGVKVDLIAHRYKTIDKITEIDGIRIMGIRDLIAMKLNAIANRGSKKDFWDCAALLEEYSLDEQLGFFSEKYPQANIWQVQKSLCYFDDAENDPEPDALNTQTWEAVKESLVSAARNILQKNTKCTLH